MLLNVKYITVDQTQVSVYGLIYQWIESMPYTTEFITNDQYVKAVGLIYWYLVPMIMKIEIIQHDWLLSAAVYKLYSYTEGVAALTTFYSDVDEHHYYNSLITPVLSISNYT